MNGKTAGMLLLGVSVLLAVLLLSEVIAPVAGIVIFAVCLVSLGIMSGGFRRK